MSTPFAGAFFAGIAVAVTVSTAGEQPTATTRVASGAERVPAWAQEFLLVGVIVRDDAPPLAIIQDRRTGKHTLYRVGAQVGQGRVTAVTSDRVTLTDDAGDVVLRLAGVQDGDRRGGAAPARPSVTAIPEPPVPPAPTESPFPRVERSVLDQYLRAPDVVMNVTSMPDRGVRVEEVRSATFFSVLQLRRGDVIRSINGRTPGAALSVARAVEQALTTSQVLRVEIERSGQMDVKYIHVGP